MITRIEIDGFKTFDDFSLDLPPFLVLLGANGSGKSNLLEAVDLLGRLILKPNSQTLVRHVRRGGPRELFRRRPGGELMEEIRIGAAVLVQTHRFGLLHLRVDATIGYREAPEPLAVDLSVRAIPNRVPGLRPDVTGGSDEYAEALNQDDGSVRGLNRAVSLELKHAAAGWRILDPVASAMRQPSDAYDSEPLAEDGRNFGAVLGHLWERDPEGRAAFEADVAAVLPDVREIAVVRDEDRALWDVWVRHKNEPRVSPRAVSAGTLRTISLLAAAHDPRDPGVLMVEEPENGLHPSRVPRLLERIGACATDLRHYESPDPHVSPYGRDPALRQILVTSHSPVVLASLLDRSPHDVVFLDTVTRLGGGAPPTRLTRARTVAETGERGTYVTPMEVHQYLNPVGYAHGA
ncbi:AAA family ATPase [Streptomyces sp. NPDC059755]|uniref:AAA family ATPase n=1 Tax=Streptomyces sp. NPDC059755 TaxID=3346934 RepID=UPI003651D7B5